MTIKEIETRSEMARSNIRLYEAEGLLFPERGENGYRNYSENDLEILKRIKLLRTFHIPLEEIKTLNSGADELAAALDRHLARLERDREDIGRSQEVCRVMRDDGAGRRLRAEKFQAAFRPA